jgi:proline dehydrogenase
VQQLKTDNDHHRLRDPMCCGQPGGMTATGRAISSVLDVLPASVIRRAARRYLGGATVAEAMGVARSLAADGMPATLAVVGEAAQTPQYADKYVRELLAVTDAVAGTGLDVRLGVKLTGLGLVFDRQLASTHLLSVAEAAAAAGCVVEVDMEQARYVDRTLDMVRAARATMPNVEAVAQAELYRTASDVRALVADHIPIRVVKGAYKEGRVHAYGQPEVIRDSYLDAVRQYLQAGVHVGVATHDEYLIFHVQRMAEELGAAKDAYEFQMLKGIQEQLRAALVRSGHPVRVTVNFGADAHKWSLRRLKENPEIIRHMISSIGQQRRQTAP